jgi:MFS family permease
MTQQTLAAERSDGELKPDTTRMGIAFRVKLALRALRHRNFRLFFGGQLISLIGTWMQSVAQSWLVYRLTGSSLLLGSVGFAGLIPVFLLAPVGGAVADRSSRHRVVLITQTSAMVLALTLSGLTLSGLVQVWQIFILASSLGVVNAFDIPARQAFIVEMVGREDMVNAIALNSSMFNCARVAGPAVAGLLVAAIGEGWCFFLNGISYVAVIAGLLMMTVQPSLRPRPQGSPLRNILEGFGFVRRTTPVRSLLLLIGISSLLGMPYSVLMPIFADRILHCGARGLGILMGATGVGALIGALIMVFRSGLKGLERWVAFACAGFAVSLGLFSMSRSFWLSTAFLLGVGFCMMMQHTASNTLIQAMAPDHLRGRVVSVYSMMFMGMAPFGSLFAGALAQRFGAPTTVAIGAAGCLMGAASFGFRLSSFQQSSSHMIMAQAKAAAEEATYDDVALS